MSWDDPAFDKYRAPGASPLEGFTETLSRKVGLDPYYTKLLLERESGHLDPSGQVSALSSAGAMGPMQVMPETGAEMARKYGIDFATPAGQTEAGVRYYKELLDRFGDPSIAAAAYHSGPTRVAEIVGRKGDLSVDLGPVGRDYYKWFKSQLEQRQPQTLAPPPAAAAPTTTGMLVPPPRVGYPKEEPGIVQRGLEGIADVAESTFELPGIKQFHQVAGAQKGALERHVLSPLLGYGEGETLGGQLQKGAKAIEPVTPGVLKPVVGLAAGVGGAIVDIASDPLVWEMAAAGSVLGPKGAAAGGVLGLIRSTLLHAPRLMKGLATGQKIAHAGFLTGMAQHAATSIPRGLAGIIENPDRVEPWMEIGGGSLSGFMVAHGLTMRSPIQQGRVKFSLEDPNGNLVPMDPWMANELMKSPGIKQVAEMEDLAVSSLWQMLRESREAPDTPLPEMHLLFGSKSRAQSEATPGGGRLGLDIGHLLADAAALGPEATPQQRSIFLANWIYRAAKHEIDHLLLEGGVDHTLPIEFRREAGELARKAYGEVDSILSRPGDLPSMSYEEYATRLQALAERHGVTLDTSVEAYNRVAAESEAKVGVGGVAAIMAKMLRHPDPVGFIDRYKANPREAWNELPFENIEPLWQNLINELGGLSQVFPAAYMEQIAQGLTRPPGELLTRQGGTVVPVPKMGTNVPKMGTLPPPPMLAEGEFGKGGKPGSKKGRRGFVATMEPRTSAAIPETVLKAGAVHPEYAADRPLGAEVAGGIPTRPVERGVSGGDLTPIMPTRPETAKKAATEIEKQRLLNQIARQRRMKAGGEVGEDEAYIASKMEPDRADELVTLAKSYARERPVVADADKQFWIDREQERRAALAKRGTFLDTTRKYMKAAGEDLTPEERRIIAGMDESRGLEEPPLVLRTKRGEASAKQQAFLNDVQQMGSVNPLNQREVVINGVRVGLAPKSDGSIYIASIENPRLKGESGKGAAADVLRMLKELSDKHGIGLSGFAYPFGAKARPAHELRQYYKDQGFEVEEGGDFRRPPKMKAEGEEESVYKGKRGAPKGIRYRRRIEGLGEEVDTAPTGREKQVLELTAEGLSAREISEKLGLSFFTVRNHMAHMRERADAASMGEMIKFAREKGWIAKGKEAELEAPKEAIRDLVSAGMTDAEIAKELGTSKSSLRREILDIKELLGVKGKRGALMRAAGEKKEEKPLFGTPRVKVAGGRYFRAAEIQGPTAPERKALKRHISADMAPRLRLDEEGEKRLRAPGFGPPPREKRAAGARGPSLKVENAVAEAIEAMKREGKDVSHLEPFLKRMKAGGEEEKPSKLTDLFLYRTERGRRFQEEETARQDEIVEKVMKEEEAREARERAAGIDYEHGEKASERTKLREDWVAGRHESQFINRDPAKRAFELRRRKNFVEAMTDYVQRTARPSHKRQMEIFKQFFPELPKTEYPMIMGRARLPIVKDFAPGYEDWRKSFFTKEYFKERPKTAEVLEFKPPPKMEAAGEKKLDLDKILRQAGAALTDADVQKILEGAERIKAEKAPARRLSAYLGRGLGDFISKRDKEIAQKTKDLIQERKELELRKPEVVVPAIKKMKAEGEPEFEEYSTGTGEGFKKMFMQRIYGSTSPGKTWAKEVTQNILDAFDDIRDDTPKFKGKAEIGYDTKEGVLTAKDNGVGMSPEFMKEHFLNPGDSGKRGKDRRGNFGIAKLALFGVGDPFEVKTVWEDPATGKRWETQVRGNGIRWIRDSKAEITKPVETTRPTGTDIRVVLDKDVAGFGSEGVDPVELENYIKKTMSSKFLEDDIGLTIDGVPQVIEKGKTWLRYGKDPGTWEKPYKYQEDKFSTPAADYEFSWRPSEYEGSRVLVSLYNRGQLQSEGYENNMSINVMTPIKGLPTDLIVNVKSKVPATDKDYPWEFDRKNLKADAKARVEEWLRKKIAAGQKETANKFQELEDAAPSIGASPMKFMAPDSFVTYDKQVQFDSIPTDPFTLILANAMAGGANKLIRAITGTTTKSKVHLGYSKDWHGLNAPGPWYPDGKTRIFLNPWNAFHKVFDTPELREILKKHPDPAISGLTPDEVHKVPSEIYAKHANLFATEMMGTALHEATHNLERGHGEEFAGALTRSAARGFIVGSRAWKPLADILSNPELMEKLRGQAEFLNSLGKSYTSPFSGAVSERVPAGRPVGLRGEAPGLGAAETGGRDPLTRKVMKADAEEVRKMAEGLRPEILRALRSRLHSSLKGTPWEDLGLEGLRSVRTPLPEKISSVMEKLNDLGATAEEVDRVEGFAKYDPLWEKLGAPRAVITSLDLSGILRQGVIGTARLTFQNPGALASAIRKSVVALASENEFKKSMESVESSPDFDFLKGLGVDFAKGEEQFGGARFVDGVFKRVTGGRLNFVRASERAYTYYLNRLRYELGKHHLDSLRKIGFEADYNVDLETGKASISGPDAAVYRKMASWINIATGRGQLPQGKGQFATAVRSADKFLNMVFFSPRLMLARLATLYPGTYTSAFMEMAKSKGALKATRGMMAMHVGDMTAYAGLVAASMAMLQAAFPDSELEGDMTSSDFGQVRMGNTRVDVSGGLRTYITTTARVLSGETTTEYGVVKPQQARETILKFFQGKLGPLPGLALTLAEGQNLVGDPAYGPLKDVLTGNEPITPEVLQEILKVTGGTLSQNTVMPMIVSDMQRLLSQNDFSPLQIAMLMSYMGVGAGVSTREAQEGLTPKVQEALRGTKVEPMGRPTTISTPFKDALGKAIELKLPYMAQRHLEAHSDKTFYEILDRVVRQDSFQRMPPAAQRMVVLQLLADARSARSPRALQELGSQRFLPMVEKERYPESLTRLLPPPPGMTRQKRWTDIGDWVE